MNRPSARQRLTQPRILGLAVLLGVCLSIGAAQQSSEGGSGVAVVLTIQDAIGPATSDFFVRALGRAEELGAELVILQLDTPGGLDTAMREMIQAILAARVPVAIYVAPSGARAASAGTYLLYAAHVAAMAPATNLGAATPVQIGGSEPPQREPAKESDPDADKATAPGSAMERKAVNDAVAYIRGLAELRGRNADWAESAVRTGASLSANAALEQRAIDVIAKDLPELLQQIDGRTVQIGGADRSLRTAGIVIERIETDWRTKILAVLTNPNVAYLLMLVGAYGLLLEGYNPGAILPGVVGAICLLLALYAFQVLSVNYAGLALMVLGLALIVAESFAPSFGALGIGGTVAFVVGSIILMDSDVPGFRISRVVIGGMAVTGAAAALITAGYFARSRRRPVVTGKEQLLRERAIALADFEESGQVRVRGEIWRAVTRVPVKEGQRLRVQRVDGLTLEVAPES